MKAGASEAAAAVQKDESQLRQKRMIAEHFKRLAHSEETGEKNAYTFVPGNLTELLRSFDLLPVLPEINALQSGMRDRRLQHHRPFRLAGRGRIPASVREGASWAGEELRGGLGLVVPRACPVG